MRRVLSLLRSVSARLPKRRIALVAIPLLAVGAVVAFALGAIPLGIVLVAILLLLCAAAGALVVRRRRRALGEQLDQLNRILEPRTMIPPLTETEYATSPKRSPWVLLRLGARYRSSRSLEMLALRATCGEHGWDRLRALLLEGDGITVLPGHWRHKEVLAASYLGWMLRGSPSDIEVARRAVRIVLDTGEHTSFKYEAQLSWALQSAVFAGDAELVERLARFEYVYPAAVWAARLDLSRPSELDAALSGGSGLTTGDEAIMRWWHDFNWISRHAGIEGWELRDGDPAADGDLFSCIHAPESPEADSFGGARPLVSVIVPTYNPKRGFLHTIESLSRQSWRELEILIVDDASSEGGEHIDAAAASDERVRVVRMERNGGAYRARNAGLREARGEFVTVLDSDDLAHSRRIELQLRPFFEDPEPAAAGSEESMEVIGTLSRAVRLLSDGRMTLLGFTPERMNTSSLLFRRDRIVSRIGYYDEVRKAGDTEYLERMLAAFENGRIAEVGEHLGLTQLTGGSLSRGDFKPGNWHSGDRVAYRNQFRGWHAALKEAGDEADFRILPGAPRRFHAPAALLGERRRDDFDLAVMRDWSRAVERADDWASAVSGIAARTGVVVGLLNAAHPRYSGHAHTAVRDRTRRLVDDGSAEWLSWESATRVGTLIVTDPEYLLLLPDREAIGVRPERVIVILESLVNLEGRRLAGVRREAVEAACERSLGLRPQWTTADAALADYALGGAVDEGVLAGFALFARTPAPGVQRPERLERSKPVIGLVNLAPAGDQLPYDAWLRRELPEREFTVLREQFGRGVHAYDVQRDIVAQSDIVIIDPFDLRGSIRHDLVWEALRLGTVVVAPERYRLVYGDAVVSGAADRLGGAVRSVTDAEARREHLAQAERFVAERDPIPMLRG